ncbi:hypothetical protein [Streptomyces canus]|uniref:hypothetical protein n=1 Tax=Streptomyces canus TaxID=58343 RepID=UPI002E300F7A|nr:hypothetical protein [Streptomyces canus]
MRIFQLAIKTMMVAYHGPFANQIDAVSPYFLQGWRSELPDYVRQVMDGSAPQPEISENLAGIMILHL